MDKNNHWFRKIYHSMSLSTLLTLLFTVTAVAAIVLTGVSNYSRFSLQLRATVQAENQSLIEQVDNTFAASLRGLMKVSDSLVYGIIKGNDFSTGAISSAAQLLYDTNKDTIECIALYTDDGQLVTVAPPSLEKARLMKSKSLVTEQDWFIAALERAENLHFSMPHVQNLFVNSNHKHPWVISLSQEVDITIGGEVRQAILLVDMKYAAIEDVFSNAALASGGYTFVMNSEGDLVYHPQKQLVEMGAVKELNSQIAGLSDGSYTEKFNKEDYSVIIKTVGYTGWKIVGVMPASGLALSNVKSTIFFIALIMLFITALVLINTYISARVSRPLLMLEKAVKQLADGNLDADIPTVGFFEVLHLEKGIQKMAVQIKQLMHDMVKQEQGKRKSELDALQSQINPHFLYNTLDIIVWMIENRREDDAVRAVTALARLFRISLAKGKAIIPVRDELEHIRNYLMIQEMRYKNKFVYTIEGAPEALNLATTKLILQPLVENAIYHGMEFMDGDGEIDIRAKVEGGTLIFTISDNGPGMPPETAMALSNGDIAPSKRGSGIGVRNVLGRIKLTYGEEYGLFVHSEPDCGTKITLCLPAKEYEAEGGGNS